MTHKVIEHNVSTGEIVEREMTAKEAEIFEQDQAKFLEELALEQAAREAREASIESAKNKLAALGLSEDEISAIIGA